MYAARVAERGAVGGPLQRAPAPVHLGAARLAAAARRSSRAPRADPGPAAVAAQPAERLPLPPSVPVRDGRLQESARARPVRGRPGHRPGVLPRRQESRPEARKRLAAHGRRGATSMAPAHELLLVVEGLKKHFPVRRGSSSRRSAAVQAVDGVSFTVRSGRDARRRRRVRAAASRRWRAASSACSSRRPVASSSRAGTSRTSPVETCDPCGAR